MVPQVYLVNVFSAAPGGGNPAPIVADAGLMSDRDMQAIARASGHESAFVLPAPEGADYDFRFRFWVPNHEMEMCGHATVGAVWLLEHLGRLKRDQVRIFTQSGIVTANVTAEHSTRHVEISQPQGTIARIEAHSAIEADILSVLGVTRNDLAPFPIENARTSRVKTLVPLKSVETLDQLRPQFERVEEVCERAGSTGLYPYAASNLTGQVFDARQFPKSSGYPEDAATGIAAAALAFALLENGLVEANDRPIRVRQGRAMGRPSEIKVRFRGDGEAQGCWLGGGVNFEAVTEERLGDERL